MVTFKLTTGSMPEELVITIDAPLVESSSWWLILVDFYTTFVAVELLVFGVEFFVLLLPVRTLTYPV